jgi:vancomycin resistance protein YoaR
MSVDEGVRSGALTGEGMVPVFGSLRSIIDPSRWVKSASRLVPRCAAIAALALLAIALTISGALALHGRGHIMPGVWIGRINVGGLDAATAQARVETGAATMAQQPLRLKVGDRVWTPRPADVGITYDARASVDAAMAFGRRDHVGAGLLHVTRLTTTAAAVPLAVTFDWKPFNAYMDRLEKDLGSGPVDATVGIDGTKVTVTPARAGRGIDRAAIHAALVTKLGGLQPIALELAQRAENPAIGTDEANRVKEQLDRALAAPLLLTIDDRALPVAANDLAALVRVTQSVANGQGALTIGLDQPGLSALVAKIGGEVDAVTADARVEDLDTHQRLVAAARGQKLRRGDLAHAIERAIASGGHTIALEVDQTGPEPRVSTEQLLAKLGATDVLATGDSAFAGSDPGRASNVLLAASLIDDTLIPPGGTFSYNAALGSIFDTPGFVEADSTIGGVLETAEGGGVCQVSTTVFRAALRAGLPITEWWPHIYRSPYYEQGGWSPGFDASITQVSDDPEGGTDLLFENPTDSWLLVKVAVEGETSLRVELRGTDPGYDVRIDDPIVETPESEDAPIVTVVRQVEDADGNEISSDTFVTAYQSRDATQPEGGDAAVD